MCSSLPNPTNGMVRCSPGSDGVLTLGDNCTFSCDPDYVLEGSTIRTCLSSGSWSARNPTCNISK